MIADQVHVLCRSRWRDWVINCLHPMVTPSLEKRFKISYQLYIKVLLKNRYVRISTKYILVPFLYNCRYVLIILVDIFMIQVNLFQEHLFLYQLTHNMTTDFSLNYEFSTWKLQAQNMCTQIRDRPDWAYEFPDCTGPDTQICRTGLFGVFLYS